jgi:DnaJ-domain-containing protein 1
MSTNVATSDPRTTASTILADATAVPWRELSSRIREALTRRNYFVGSSDDLRVLWQGERVDASERRRRITVFAAQHHWKVEARADGHSARFLLSTPSGLISRESLSRNHE